MEHRDILRMQRHPVKDFPRMAMAAVERVVMHILRIGVGCGFEERGERGERRGEDFGEDHAGLDGSEGEVAGYVVGGVGVAGELMDVAEGGLMAEEAV